MRLAVLGDFHQSVEAPHAVVDVHHVVARAQLVELGDGHLLVALDFAVDAVALVAVENLVVGVEAELQVVVDEALVKRQRQRAHDHLPAANLVKDVAQALHLGAVLREDVGLVAAQAVANHVVGQQGEVLVEGGLRRRREEHLGIGRALLQVVAQHEDAAAADVRQQAVAASQQRVDALRVVEVGHHLAAQVVDAAQHEIGVEEPEGGLLTRKAGQRDALRRGGRSREVGQNLDMVELVGGELARDFEAANRVDLVAEEVHAVGFALGKGEDVDDAAAQRVLARLVDEVDLLESGVDQGVDQHLGRGAVTHRHANRIAAERLGVGHPLGQRLGIGAHHRISVVVRTEGRQSGRTLHHPLGILAAVGDGALVGGGEETDARLVEQVVEVVEQVGRRVAVLGHEDVEPPAAGDGRGGIERERPADQLLQVDGGAPASELAAQGLELF